MKVIFESDLLTPRSTYDSKGCQEPFPEFVYIPKVSASTVPPSCPIKVDPDIPVVVHIWPGMKGIICIVKNFNKPI